MKNNIRIDGYVGTWYEIDAENFDGVTLYLLESEQYGDEVCHLIVNEANEVLLDDVCNGFSDYEDYLAYLDICHNVE